jgi:hypothetical protein
MRQLSVLPGAPIGVAAAAGSPQSPAAPAPATPPVAPATTLIIDVAPHAPAEDERYVAPVRPGLRRRS